MERWWLIYKWLKANDLAVEKNPNEVELSPWNGPDRPLVAGDTVSNI